MNAHSSTPTSSSTPSTRRLRSIQRRRRCTSECYVDHLERVVDLARKLQIGRADVLNLSTAATMIGAGVDTVYTFDSSVFSRVAGITVRSP